MVVNDKGLKALGVQPLARIHHMTVIGHDPVICAKRRFPRPRKR
jgi:acetyl-CoA C-acetyltransferase